MRNIHAKTSLAVVAVGGFGRFIGSCGCGGGVGGFGGFGGLGGGFDCGIWGWICWIRWGWRLIWWIRRFLQLCWDRWWRWWNLEDLVG